MTSRILKLQDLRYLTPGELLSYPLTMQVSPLHRHHTTITTWRTCQRSILSRFLKILKKFRKSIGPLMQTASAGFYFHPPISTSMGTITMSKDATTNPAIDFTKIDGLVPGIVQDAGTGEVLMLGFLNPRAIAKHWRPALSLSGAALARSSG